MPTFNQFKVAIFNYNVGFYNGLKIRHIYFYDGLNEDGKIIKINDIVSNHLFIIYVLSFCL